MPLRDANKLERCRNETAWNRVIGGWGYDEGEARNEADVGQRRLDSLKYSSIGLTEHEDRRVGQGSLGFTSKL